MDKWLMQRKSNEAPREGGGYQYGKAVPYEIRLQCKALTPEAILPTRGTEGSAGLDLYATESVDLWPGDIRGIHPGIAMKIPAGFCGILATRSSMGKAGVRIAAGANIIDCDYVGEVVIYLRNDGTNPWHIEAGDRVAQVVLVPVLMIQPTWADELPETGRGAGGFGSTGR